MQSTSLDSFRIFHQRDTAIQYAVTSAAPFASRSRWAGGGLPKGNGQTKGEPDSRCEPWPPDRRPALLAICTHFNRSLYANSTFRPIFQTNGYALVQGACSFLKRTLRWSPQVLRHFVQRHSCGPRYSPIEHRRRRHGSH